MIALRGFASEFSRAGEFSTKDGLAFATRHRDWRAQGNGLVKFGVEALYFSGCVTTESYKSMTLQGTKNGLK